MNDQHSSPKRIKYINGINMKKKCESQMNKTGCLEGVGAFCWCLICCKISMETYLDEWAKFGKRSKSLKKVIYEKRPLSIAMFWLNLSHRFRPLYASILKMSSSSIVHEFYTLYSSCFNGLSLLIASRYFYNLLLIQPSLIYSFCVLF